MGRKIVIRGKYLQEYIDRKVDEILMEGWNNWMPEEDDDLSDYSFGMIAKLETRNCIELGDDAMEFLQQVQDEYAESSNSYVNVMVRNANVSCDEDGYCTVTLECAVNAPDMPTSMIEDETEEILWYWLEEKTGESFPSGFDWESENVVFDRRVKNG